IAGPGVNLDNLAAQLIVLLQNQPGEVGRVLQLGNDGPLDGNVKALKHAGDQVVGEGPFLRGVAQEHADDHAHVVLDLNDEDLLLVPDEDRAAPGRGEDAA